MKPIFQWKHVNNELPDVSKYSVTRPTGAVHHIAEVLASHGDDVFMAQYCKRDDGTSDWIMFDVYTMSICTDEDVKLWRHKPEPPQEKLIPSAVHSFEGRDLWFVLCPEFFESLGARTDKYHVYWFEPRATFYCRDRANFDEMVRVYSECLELNRKTVTECFGNERGWPSCFNNDNLLQMKAPATVQ